MISDWDYDDTNASFINVPRAQPVITSALQISPGQDTYHVGDLLTAQFSITNQGNEAITFEILAVGGRLNGWCLPEGCPDFTHRSLTLQPGGVYQYQGALTLSRTGDYHFFCAYKSQDGIWNTNIDVEIDGEIIEDFAVARRYREANITMSETTYITTALGPASWEPISGPWDDWPQDQLGSSWNLIQAIAVNPHNAEEIYVAAMHRTSNWWESQGTKLYRSENGGESWLEVTSGLPRLQFVSYYWPIAGIAIAPSNSNVVYAGTTDFDPQNVDVFAGLSHSMGVYKTTTGGQTWSEWNGSETPSPPPGSTPPFIITAFPEEFSVSSMIVDPTKTDLVYAGTVGGGIWRTFTLGEGYGWRQIWKPMGVLFYDVNALAISLADPNTVYAAVYNYASCSGLGGPISPGYVFQGGLYRYRNGEWNTIYENRRVDDIVVAEDDVNTLYIVTNGYNVFKSTNGGQSWEDVSGEGEDSLPDVFLDSPWSRPAYSLELCPHSKWLFAASPLERQAMGVYFSPNSGKNWFPIGLQDENVKQLVLASTPDHHVLYAATTRNAQKGVHLFKYDFSDSAIEVGGGSPVEIRVCDSDGHVTGVVNGKPKAEIPKSVFVDGTITILSSTGPYTYEILGVNRGLYILKISSVCGGNLTTFTATAIPTFGAALHRYTIDWDALARGEEGVTLQIDNDGDGIFERTITSGSELTGEDFGLVPSETMINHGPNPVPAEGCIFWINLPDDAISTTLKIFDIDGALIVSIPLDPTADRYPAAGRWIPEDDQGRLLGTGLYLYLVEIEHTDGTVTYSPVQKMVIQR